MLKVYHGSYCKVEKPETAKGRGNLDFGKGFYITDIQEQAKKWAVRFINRDKGAFLNIYHLDLDLVEQKYRTKHFSMYNEEWLDYIIACRNGEDIYQNYDIVIGGIADDRIFNTLELYLDGLIDKTEALKRLKYEKPNNQICILNQKIIDDYLIFIECLSL